MVSEAKLVRIASMIPVKLRTRLRIASAGRDTTMQAIIIEALDEYLTEIEKAQRG